MSLPCKVPHVKQRTSQFMQFESKCREVGRVTFPRFLGERVYMEEFNARNGHAILRPGLHRWQDTIDAMLCGVETDGPIYLMIDQKEVKPGDTHRRPGPHIDGYWQVTGHDSPESPGHAHPGRGPTHISPTPRWRIPDTNPLRVLPRRIPKKPKHEAIVLASNVYGCDGFLGTFDVESFGRGGDCSCVPLDRLQRMALAGDVAYSGNVSFIHESVPVREACQRTLVRLNVPGIEL